MDGRAQVDLLQQPAKGWRGASSIVAASKSTAL
jgi:hypothetical protein